jgi:hypothetical protein
VPALTELSVNARLDLDPDLDTVRHDFHAQLGSYPTDGRRRTDLGLEASHARGAQARVRISREQARHLLGLVIWHESTP